MVVGCWAVGMPPAGGGGKTSEGRRGWDIVCYRGHFVTSHLPVLASMSANIYANHYSNEKKAPVWLHDRIDHGGLWSTRPATAMEEVDDP